ncbi:MAG: MDR family MFS transporter [Candidatus Limnocylindrales bacterium]
MTDDAMTEEFIDEIHVQTVEEDPALGLPFRAKMEILVAVMIGLFLGALDQTIVSVALPRIVTDLNGNDLYVWVVTIYLLTSTISVPFWGKLSDLYGRKPIFMIGIGIFLVGSALSGLSQEMWQLILFRGIQGIGAGSLFPVALAVIGDLFTPAERGKYQGLFGAVFGIAFIIGPALGGFITDTWSWHWIFYVNIPIGLVSLFLIGRLLPTVKSPRATRNFDVLGGALFTVAIGFLLVGLTNKGVTNSTTHQLNVWTDLTVGGFILIALVGIVLFGLAEARAKEPIIPLGLFRIWTYTSSMIATFFASFAFFGSIIFLPRWFQFVQGYSATASGYAALPLLVGLIASSIISGQLVARTGRYKWLTVVAIGIMGVGAALMTQLTATTPLPILWLWMFVAGVGVGPTFTVFTIIVQNAVPFHELGVATSNLTFFRQIGGTIALAIAGTVFETAFSDQLVPQMTAAGVPPQVVSGIEQASATGAFDLNQVAGVGVDLGKAILAALPPPIQAAVEPFVTNIVNGIYGAFSAAIAQTFYIGIAAAVIAAVVAATMHEHPLRTTTRDQAPVTAPAA